MAKGFQTDPRLLNYKITRLINWFISHMRKDKMKMVEWPHQIYLGLNEQQSRAKYAQTHTYTHTQNPPQIKLELNKTDNSAIIASGIIKSRY